MSRLIQPKRYVVENTPGLPGCPYCNGMGVKGKAKRNGTYKPCRCVSAEAKAAHAKRAEEHNARMKLLHESRPELPKEPLLPPKS